MQIHSFCVCMHAPQYRMVLSNWAVYILSQEFKINTAMVVVALMFAGFPLVTKTAISNVPITSLYVFAVYRNAIATVLLSPIAYFLEKEKRPNLTFRNLVLFFMSALTGMCINQISFLLGIYYTSATFTSTIQNLIPAFTFILAASLRREEIHLKGWDGRAKIFGVIISICGTMVVSCYKGPSLVRFHNVDRSRSYVQPDNGTGSQYKSLKLGILFLVGNCAAWAVWYVLQAPVLRSYPAQLTATAFTFGFATFQLLIVIVPLARHVIIWRIQSEPYLAAILYGGIIISGLAMTMLSWCAHRGGLLLVGAYQPLQTVIVICVSTIFLGETLHTGSVVGGSLITIGLYFVLWGRSKEKKQPGSAIFPGLGIEERNITNCEDSTTLEENLIS